MALCYVQAAPSSATEHIQYSLDRQCARAGAGSRASVSCPEDDESMQYRATMHCLAPLLAQRPHLPSCLLPRLPVRESRYAAHSDASRVCRRSLRGTESEAICATMRMGMLLTDPALATPHHALLYSSPESMGRPIKTNGPQCHESGVLRATIRRSLLASGVGCERRHDHPPSDQVHGFSDWRRSSSDVSRYVCVTVWIRRTLDSLDSGSVADCATMRFHMLVSPATHRRSEHTAAERCPPSCAVRHVSIRQPRRSGQSVEQRIRSPSRDHANE